MKKSMLAFLSLIWFALMINHSLLSQKITEFPKAWEHKFNFDCGIKDFNEDGSLILGANEKEIIMLNGSDGKTAWFYKFNDKFKIKKFESVVWNKDAGAIMLANEDDGKKKSVKIIVDDKTGEELWRTTEYDYQYGDEYYLHASFVMNYVFTLNAFPAYDGSKIDLLDIKTGKMIWTIPGCETKKKDEFSISIIDGYEVFMVTLTYEHNMKLYDAISGKVIDDKSVNKFLSKRIREESSSLNNMKMISSESNEMVYMLNWSGSQVASSYYMGIASLNMSGKERNISATAYQYNAHSSNYEFLWTSSFKGKVIALLGEEDQCDAFFSNDKIFVIYEGITILDGNTGKIINTLPYKKTDYDFSLKIGIGFGGLKGGKKKSQTLNVAAAIEYGNNLYVADLSEEKNNHIYKYNVNTGQILWKTTNFKKNDIIPHIAVSDKIVLAQFGGFVTTITYETMKDINLRQEGGIEAKTEIVNEMKGDDFGIKAYDVETGKLLWDTKIFKEKVKDDFDDYITNMIVNNGTVYVCSEKNLFAIEANTGNIKYNILLKDFKLGNVLSLFIDDSTKQLYAECEKGVFCVDKSDGKIIFSTKTDKFFGSFRRGNNYFVYIGANRYEQDEFVGINLENGAIKGKYKYKKEKNSFIVGLLTDDIYKGYNIADFTSDGDSFISFKDKTATKYITK